MDLGKRGDTLVNFAFIIGMLLLAAIVTIILTRFSLFQGKQLQTDVLLSFTGNIKNTIEKAQSSPNDADFIIRVDRPIQYRMTIGKGQLNLEFSQYKFNAKAISFAANTNIVGKTIENSGTIYVVKRGNTILITDSMKCDTTDNVCDPACIIEKKCDPACYQDYIKDVCNQYCVDANHDSKIDQKDLDGVCDPDCYGNDYRGTYDPDCLKNNDNVCDPNSDNNPDGFCDMDCLITNGVCDSDCSQSDADCPHSGNNICEVKRGERCINEADCACDATQTCLGACPGVQLTPNGCINNSNLFQEGAACTQQCQCAPGLLCDSHFGTYHCCPAGNYFDSAQDKCVPNVGDGVCKVQQPFGETCQNSTADCACNGGGCCPSSSRANPQGCVMATQNEGDACSCDSECVSPLACDVTNQKCCPAGKEWDTAQNKCVIKKKFRLLFLPMFYDTASESTFKSNSDATYNFFIVKSPFQTCTAPSEHVEEILAPVDMCRSAESSCTGYVPYPGLPGLYSALFSNACANAMMDCVDNSQFAGKYDKVLVINNDARNHWGPGSGGICGSAFNIPSPLSATDFPSPCPDPSSQIEGGHENGHALGLYHIVGNIGGMDCSGGGACMGPNAADCNEPLASRVGDIMTYCRINDHYGPAAYSYLKNVVFKPYLTGC